MISNDQYLRPMLNSGSSRVFNCNDCARKLMKEEVVDPYFFNLKRMHGLILIKETISQSEKRSSDDRVIGTKLYIPYNQDDVYEGGRSIFYHDPRLLDVLNEFFGLHNNSPDEADLRHDITILGVLDRLPSLDGFLMRDALELEGVAANELYFEVSKEERATIHDYVRRKFEPLVRRACGDGSPLVSQVNHLIDKIWEAKDKTALAPLTQAFRFPENDALAIFAAWKGINFYTFEYSRAKQKRERFGLWLRDGAVPRNVVAKHDLEFLKQQRRTTAEQLREHWSAIETISREYEQLYSRFLTTPDGVGDFLKFLRRSHEIYWTMGVALSKINHAVHCWEVTANGPVGGDQRLPAEKLSHLLDMLQLVLGGARKPAPAVAWQ